MPVFGTECSVLLSVPITNRMKLISLASCPVEKIILDKHFGKMYRSNHTGMVLRLLRQKIVLFGCFGFFSYPSV